MTTTLGAVFLPQLPPERLPGIARAADAAGLEELWLWEDCFLESGIAAAAAALAGTERLRVGIGLLPVPLRNVALTAMEVATLHRMFPGRIRVGVGHGVQDWMGQVGARAASPLTLLREYVPALRALLAGEKVTVDGRYVHLDGVALGWPPLGPVPILVGAAKPRTLRLSGELADGTILTGGTTPEDVRTARTELAAARDTAGPDTADPNPAAHDTAGADTADPNAPDRDTAGPDTADPNAPDRDTAGRQAPDAGRDGRHSVVVYLHAATGPDAEARMEAERIRWGYPSLAGRAVTGDAPAIAGQVRHWFAAGADTVVLQPTPDEPDYEGFLRFVARDVRPLLEPADRE